MTIAVLNQKGGVGKTTTAINLAHALAEWGETVTILDADSQQQALTFAGMESVEGIEIVPALGAQALKKAVEKARAARDWVIIDCPPSLQEAAPAVPLCDLVLAPVPPRRQDLSGFARLRETVDAARERGNPHLQLKILVSLRDSRISLQAAFEARLREAFGPDVLQTVIPRAAVFERAAAADQSVLAHAPSSPAAHAFRALAQEIRSLKRETEGNG